MPILAFALSNWKWVLMAVLVAAYGVQTWRLDLCQKGRLKDQVAAEAVRIRLEGSLAAQNEAIAKLGEESRNRKAAAEKALKTAREGTQKARTEAERLRALARTSGPKTANSECPAGLAVLEIRRGLQDSQTK